VNQQDLVLVRDSMRGDTEAFTMLVRNYKDFVYRIVYAILQNHVDTEDVLQETFIKAYQSIIGLRDERTFPSWIARIATRTALDWKQRMNRLRAVPVELEQIVSERDPNKGIRIRVDLENALGQMSTEHRAILVLREIHGFDYEEIAGILKIPVGTVRSRLFNARVRLRRILQGESGGQN
jgi:RNA polymerase sigma-70 factor, ECF subfamily